MTPIGSKPATCADRLNHLLNMKLHTRAKVRAQNPIQIMRLIRSFLFGKVKMKKR